MRIHSRALLAAGITVGLSGLGFSSSLADSAVTKSYVAAEGFTVGIGAPAPDTNVGGAGFTVAGGTVISVAISDMVSGAVNGQISFTDSPLNGKTVGSPVDVCKGSVTNVTVPDGAAEAFVFVPVSGVSGSACGSKTNGATKGTITLTTAGAEPAAAPIPAVPSHGKPASRDRVQSAAADGAFTMDYILGGGDGAVSCPLSGQPGINGVCDTKAGAGPFDISIADASGQPASAVMSFRDGTGANLAVDPVPFCTQIKGFKMPAGAAQIFIRIGVVGRSGGDPTGQDPTGILPSGQPKANLPCGAPTVSTKGTVTIASAASPAASAQARPASSIRAHGVREL
ncbi:MAG: hypothetical protein ACYDGR_10125 [Candidatus Dormibacteria bacterium]